MKKKSLLFLFALLSCFYFSAKAERVEQSVAQTVAINFMAERTNLFSSAPGFSTVVSDVIARQYDNITVYYAVNFAGGGFVIVAADDILTPVIGYAYSGAYASENRPCCFEHFIDTRAEEAAYLIAGGYSATPEISGEWHFLKSGETRNFSPDVITSVQPLVISPWNQDFPYNALCPEDPDGPGGHVYAGCVATAMAMIMYYYRYPDHGFGSKTHHTPYGSLHVNYGETWYDWNAMQNTITYSSGNSIAAVAELQYHCGVAVNMSYGPGGSGAYSQTVPSVTRHFFRYADEINYIDRSGHSYSNWANILIGQFDSGHPVYYSGHGSGGGHAWVCDGYEFQGTNAYFHMNWGWGGAYHGFYHLDDLNPGGGGNFNNSQGIVRNFYPHPDNYPMNQTSETRMIASTRGSVEDGSGPFHNYQHNLNNSWLIAPTDSVHNITLTFLKFNTQDNDIVTIYDGEDENAPVLGSFYGSALPGAVTSSGNRMFITFVTDAGGNAPGWLAEFNSSIPVFCSGMKTITSLVGSFEDGSGHHNYNHNSLCRWYIKPTGAESVTLNFNSFNTQHVKDYVQILQIPGNQVLGQFSGDEIPQSVTSNTGQMMVIFITNQFENAPGWSAYYTADGLEMQTGDANCDGIVDVLDVVIIVSYIVGENPQPFCFVNADINDDGLINVQDVVGTVNIVLRK
jgi:hypothetical protein